MDLTKMELVVISVMWNRGVPLSTAEITLSLYPVYPPLEESWSYKRVAKRVNSLLKKDAIRVNPNSVQNGNVHYDAVYTREAHIAYVFDMIYNYNSEYFLVSVFKKIKRKFWSKDV